jgi:hypothetical protein
MPILIEDLPSKNENSIDKTKQIQEEIPELEKNNFNIEPIPFEDKTNQIESTEKKVESQAETINESECSDSSVSIITPQASVKTSAFGPNVRYYENVFNY